MVPVIIAACVIALGVSLALIVKLPASGENLAILIVLSAEVIDGQMMLVLGMRGFGEVYEKSKQALRTYNLNMSGVRCHKDRRWTRKFLKSCGAIKMKFGGNNFVDRLTPLNCISHSLQLSVQILLLTTNK